MAPPTPPPAANSMVARADHLMAIGRAAEARDLLLGDPATAQDHEALVALSHAHDKLGDYTDSLQAGRAAMGLNPDSASASLMTAVALMKLDRPVDALGPARRGLELAPNHHGAHQIVARVLADLGRFDQAQVHVDRVLALDPDGVSGWVTLCRLRLSQRRWADAEEAARRALAADPDSDEAKLLLSVAQASAGGSAKRNEAMETLIASLRSNPDQRHVKDLLIELVKPTRMPIPAAAAALLILAGGGGVLLVIWAVWVGARWGRTPPDVKRLVWSDRRARWQILAGLAASVLVCLVFAVASVLVALRMAGGGCVLGCDDADDGRPAGTSVAAVPGRFELDIVDENGDVVDGIDSGDLVPPGPSTTTPG